MHELPAFLLLLNPYVSRASECAPSYVRYTIFDKNLRGTLISSGHVDTSTSLSLQLFPAVTVGISHGGP